jgi:hypothetical protein
VQCIIIIDFYLFPIVRCVHVLSGHVSAVTALAIPVDGTIFLS